MEFKDLCDFLDVPLVLLKVNGPGTVILDCNLAYSEHSGKTSEDLHGRPFFEVFPDNPFLDFGTPWANIFDGIDAAGPGVGYLVHRWELSPELKVESFRVKHKMVRLPEYSEQVLLRALYPVNTSGMGHLQSHPAFPIHPLPWSYDPSDGRFILSPELRADLGIHHDGDFPKELFKDQGERDDFHRRLEACVSQGVPLRLLYSRHDDGMGPRIWLISGFQGSGSVPGIVLGDFTEIPDAGIHGKNDPLEEDRLRKMVSSIEAIIWEGDVGDLKTTYVSPKVFDILGYTQQEWMSSRRKWEEILHPEDRSSTLHQLEDKLKDTGRFDAVYRLVHKKGHSVWVRDNVVLVPQGNGKLYLRGVMIDVSDYERWNIFKEMEGRLLESIPLEHDDFVDGLSYFLKGMQAIFEGKSFLLVSHSHRGDVLLAGPQSLINGPSAPTCRHLVLQEHGKQGIQLLEYPSLPAMGDQHLSELFDRCLSVLGLVLGHRQKTIQATELLELNRQVQQMANFGFWQWDLASGKLEWSEELFRILEKDPLQFHPSSENYIRMVHPHDRRKVTRIFQQIQKDLKESVFETRIIVPDGNVKYLRCWVKRALHGTIPQARLLGGCLDITNIHQVELQRENLFQHVLMQMRKLEESKVKYYGLFQQIPMAVLLVRNSDGRILDANQAALDAYGFTHGEFLKKDLGQLIVPKDKYNQSETTFIKDMVDIPNIAIHRTSSEDRIVVKMAHSKSSSPSDGATIILLEDITQKVGDMVAIRKKNSALRRISWIHSHLVRAPLSRILAISRLLEDWGQQDQDLQHYGLMLEKIKDAAHELDAVIREVTESSHQELNTNDKIDGE